MIITLVMDQYGLLNNGTTATARHLAQALRQNGHTVRIVTAIPNDTEDDIYVVRERHFPLGITRIIRSHGMVLGKPQAKVLEDAIKGADVVHFFLPFKLAKKGKRIADKLGVASTAGFHVQPENISLNIQLGWLRPFTWCLYRWWRGYFNKFAHIHAPSTMIESLLQKKGYKSKIHSISNGVNDVFVKRESERPPEYEGKFLVLTIGRLAAEKRQDRIIKAIGKSKHNDKIRLIMCGAGPRKKKLLDLSKKHLKNPVAVKFVTKDSLVDIINYCDLYVHASEIELEAIACMEAFACGRVPVISDAEFSATKQFALHPENIFPHNDIDELAARIDYFVENPDALKAMEAEYLELTRNYRLDKCVSELERVFEAAIADNQKRLANIAAENAHLTKLSEREAKKYWKQKCKYQENAFYKGAPDYNEDFINTLLGDDGSEHEYV